MFQPGQSAGHEDANPWSYVFEENPLLENAKDQNSLRPYPADLIDVKLNQQKIFGFFEFLGNYLGEIVDGVQYFQYMPWAEANWIKNPSPNSLIGQVWNSVQRAMGSLGYSPEVEEALAKYLQRDWGFKTLHYGSDKDDRITGSEVNDTFFTSRGNDDLSGGVGLDQLVVEGKRSGFNLNKRDASWLLEDRTSGNQSVGSDTLGSLERVKFSDVSVALDLDGNAGKVAKLLGAVFGKAALSNKEYVGVGLSLLDKGMSYQDLAAVAVSVTKKTASIDICNLLWTNVFNKAPTASDIAPFKAMLDSGEISIGALTALAADTSFNTTNIDLVGLSRTGIEYV